MTERLPKNLRRREAVEKAHAQPPEEWRPVAGFPHYEVSDLGRVLSRQGLQPRVLKPGPGNYPSVTLCGPGGVRRTATLHSLVTEAFIGPRPEGQEVRHLDGNRENNTVANLAYGTRSENAFDRVRHGTHHYAKRTHCAEGHPFDEENTFISKGARACRICARQRARDARHRRNLRAAGLGGFAA